jgi:Na+/H+ antiporter NhaB
MHFWIDIEFTKILSQFKQQKICWFIHDMQFQVLKKPFKYIFYKLYIYDTLLNKLQDHVFISSIWINFEKKNLC